MLIFLGIFVLIAYMIYLINEYINEKVKQAKEKKNK